MTVCSCAITGADNIITVAGNHDLEVNWDTNDPDRGDGGFATNVGNNAGNNAVLGGAKSREFCDSTLVEHLP